MQFVLFNIIVRNESDLLTALQLAWLIRHELSTLYENKLRSDTGLSQGYIQGISKVLGKTSSIIPIKKGNTKKTHVRKWVVELNWQMTFNHQYPSYVKFSL